MTNLLSQIPNRRTGKSGRLALGIFAMATGVALLFAFGGSSQAAKPAADFGKEFTADVRPLLQKYCLDCHSTKTKKGSLDLERFAAIEHIRREIKPWIGVVEQLEAGEMPPKGKPQPTADERSRLIAWLRGFLNAEARARAGDPGFIPLRRLSNAEYDRTIRDLTGVDLRPAREFPADGAAGEGFTNAAESLSDVSPALFNKYLAAAKDIAEHAVLLPDGLRFSTGKTRRDWSDESLMKLRAFYQPFAPDGRLPIQPYLAATIRHRQALLAGTTTVAVVAEAEKLNPKYFGILWLALTSQNSSYPLDPIRERWRTATEKEVPTLAADIAGWQESLWKIVAVGSYRYGNTTRQVANNPAMASSQTVQTTIQPAPGQTEVVLYLSARDIASVGKEGTIVWHRPRIEGAGQTLLLKDYTTFGPKFEIDYSKVFAGTADYLSAAVTLANDPKLRPADLAKARSLDAALLERWVDVVAVEPFRKPAVEQDFPRKLGPADTLELLDEHVPKEMHPPAISGWRKKGTDLPTVMANSTDKTENIPGRAKAHGVIVHPMPTEFVAVSWTSPIEGTVSVGGKIAHAHPACGNGVAWWLEHRRGARAAELGEGAIGLGREWQLSSKTVKVAKGDVLVLAIDARAGDHICDLTQIDLTITEVEEPGRKWDLAGDVSKNVLAGNPHDDGQGNKAVWRFVRGASRTAGKPATPTVPPESVLGRWREAAADPDRQKEASQIAKEVAVLLVGQRPTQEKHPDRVLFDNLVSGNGVLLRGLDLSHFPLEKRKIAFGLPKERFGRGLQGSAIDEASLATAVGEVIEVRLPAALFHGREFVVDGRLNGGDRAASFQVTTSRIVSAARWDAKTPVVSSGPLVTERLKKGLDEFRQLFPSFVCYPHVIPLDETVCLKMFHREDEPLIGLFLSDDQARTLDKMWADHRFISQQPVAENKYLPLFIGFVTQDQPKELLAYFEGQRDHFRKRAEDFEREAVAVVPKHVAAVLDFAARAYRRPLTTADRGQLVGLYDALRKKEVTHEDAIRGVLSRVLVSPAFLFKMETPPAGAAAGPVNEWQLATRLSYFLWSSQPDEELRGLAAAGRLRDPAVLAGQTKRMLQDEKSRAIGVEFGAQWLHVRGFDELNEKNEKLFPTFDPALRSAINEETVLFFQDLFRSDRPVSAILDADYTFLNETLAKHYGIPGVTGLQWQRVDGVRKYGRGGVLGLASIQAKESGASRTSPVLRGNWVVETLLGEKLPRPPANVPRLPEEEGGDGLTIRQQVEKHARVVECAVCHVRIDPFGFALEKYDPIGRLREKDLGGLPVDTRVKLRDGTAFEGIDGLRNYLATKKKDTIVRLFCRKLLGYAVGRGTALSDDPLIDEMVAALKAGDGRVSAALKVVVESPQFRMVRGRDFETHE